MLRRLFCAGRGGLRARASSCISRLNRALVLRISLPFPMKAIRVHQFGGPEVMRCEDVPTPKPGENEVLIQVRAIGVNPVDTYLRSGSNPQLSLPYTPGSDACGIVIGAGRMVRHFNVGDRVYTVSTLTGAYAEYVLAKESHVYPLASRLTYEQGAAVNIPYSTAYRALFYRARVREGESVLIHGGSGGVGIAAIQLAKAAHLAILATAGTPAGCELVLREGAHHALNHHNPNYQDEVLSATDGEGVNVILEMLANVNLGHDLRLLAKSGRVIVIGSRGHVEINPRELMSRDADIRGMMIFNTPDDDLRKIHHELYNGFETGALNPVVGCDLELHEAGLAHERILQPGTLGKLVLRVES
jgi:NADPH2:quinone reductase